jgi:hypothetical protein
MKGHAMKIDDVKRILGDYRDSSPCVSHDHVFANVIQKVGRSPFTNTALIKAGIQTRRSRCREDRMARGGSIEVRPIKELRL